MHRTRDMHTYTVYVCMYVASVIRERLACMAELRIRAPLMTV